MADLVFSGAAATWVEHLRAGGTVPWREWVAGGPHQTADGDLTDLPGASQLELLRLLNGHDPAVARSIADRVLTRPGPGRGPTELPLLWPADPTLTVGGQVLTPVDPAALPAGELLRVGAGVLADLVRDLPLPEPTAPDRPAVDLPRSPFRRRRPSFVLDGPPRTVAGLRLALAGQGLHEHRPRLDWLGGRRPPTRPDVVIVPVLPLEDLLGEVWEERARRGSPRGWRRFVRDLGGHDALPPGADPAGTAARWAAQVGPDRVHLLTPDHLDEGLRRILGLRVPATSGHRLAPVLVDVLRRHHAVQSLHLRVGDRQPRTDLLVGVLEGMGAAAPAALAVPADCRDWVADTGARVAAACGGYAGAGDPAVLTQTATDRPRRLDHRTVLPVMDEAILRVATRVQEVRR